MRAQDEDEAARRIRRSKTKIKEQDEDEAARRIRRSKTKIRNKT